MIYELENIMMAGWYDIYCGEMRCGLRATKISRGEIVTMRLVMTDVGKGAELGSLGDKGSPFTSSTILRIMPLVKGFPLSPKEQSSAP